MWELDSKESWALKNWCFWTVVLEKTLERPLECKEIQPVHPKGDQSWMFTGRTDAEAEAPVVWPPDAKSWLTRKDPDAGKDWTGGEGDDRGWDGWMALPTRWIWVWASSRSWWWTGMPGMLQSMQSQRVAHDWVTERQQGMENGKQEKVNVIVQLVSHLFLWLDFFFFLVIFWRDVLHSGLFKTVIIFIIYLCSLLSCLSL